MSVNGANEAGVAKKFVADNQKQIPKQNVTTPLPHQNTKWPKNYQMTIVTKLMKLKT